MKAARRKRHPIGGFEHRVDDRLDGERIARSNLAALEREKRRAAISPRQRARRRDAKITTEQLRAVWKLHRDGGISLARIAQELWERLGYSSWQTCYQAIRKGLYRDMRYPRERRAATRLAVETHGVFHRMDPDEVRDYWQTWRRNHGIGVRRCQGRKTRGGAHCRRYALKGSEFCGAHDPSRARIWGGGLRTNLPAQEAA